MPNTQATGSLYYLGVDGGGTKYSAILMDGEQNLLGLGLAGPANPYRGIGQTIEFIEKATRQARRLASTNPPAISILGGLKDLVYPWLDKDVAEQFVAAKRSPEFGAVIYAKKKFRDYLTTC